MKKLILFLYFSVIILQGIVAQNYTNGGTVTDCDGNVYNTVIIGSQRWMKENLRAVHYPWGVDIGMLYGTVPDSGRADIKVYGYLYFRRNIDDYYNQICPTGFKVPYVSDWENLFKFIGGSNVLSNNTSKRLTAGQLEKKTIYNKGYTQGLDKYGFSAMAAGYISYKKSYVGFESYGLYGSYFWCRENEEYVMIASDEALGIWFTFSQSIYDEASVRCMQDVIVDIPTIKMDNEIKITPNPVIDIIHINKSYSDLCVYNSIGALVKHFTNGQKEINVTDLTNGIYIIKGLTSDGIFEQKLIKK